MAPVYKLSSSSVKNGRMLYGSMLAGNASWTVPDTGAMFPLQVITVGATAVSSVTFSNIPSTYSHLQIRGIARMSSNAAFKVTFNGSTGTYRNHYLEGTGATAIAGTDTLSHIELYPGISTANIFTGLVWDILDYANTNKNKVIRAFSGYDANGTGYIDLDSGLWVNTAAITSITVACTASATFQQYTQFALYGVKSA